MKRILVNATQQEELRVAIVDGQKLYNLDIEAAGKKQKKGNIYKGVISSIAPSLNAVFVDYGGVRQGFLPIKEIRPEYLSSKFKGPYRKQAAHELVKEGQELIIQIAREERDFKGASLTTYITLTGQYLVLLPNKSRVHGVSQRISGTDRRRIINLSHEIATRENEGIILRTACLNTKKEDLQKNLNYLRYLWKQIQKAFNQRPAPFLIYKEANIVLQTIQSNMGPDIDQIIIDNQEVYEETKEFLSIALPHYKRKLKLYDGNIPLFNRMQIEAQIESLYQHTIALPSGGSIVLDHTEALTTIDINSSRSTQQHDLEETALATNLEAVDEITRQLRLRDIGGLLVIDFIDMMSRVNKRKVEEHLQNLLKKDRARTRLGNISKFGLLEMSRQRTRPSLKDASEILCPRCNGRGFIRTVKSCALVILRLIEEEAGKAKTEQVVGQVPSEVDKFLINEKRNKLDEIEQQYGVKVSIVSDPQMETPHYKIMRHREISDLDDNKDRDSVIVRSSLYEQQMTNQQDEEETSVEEKPEIPTVVPMKRATLGEVINNFWQKLRGIFARKDTPGKRSRRTYRRRRGYSGKRAKSSYTNKRQKSRNRSSYKRDYTREKPRQSRNASRSTRGSTEQRNFKRKSKFSPLKSSIHSNRRRRQNQRSKTSDWENQHQTSANVDSRNNMADSPTKQETAATKAANENVVSQPPNTPRETKQKPTVNPSKIYKPPQFSNKESKLIQIETKPQNGNNPK